MNKLELIQEVKDKCGLIGHEATQLVNIFFSELANALANGDSVRGFCSFFIKKYEGYTERNPKTGGKVQIPAKKLPFFKCGKELKERVDYL